MVASMALEQQLNGPEVSVVLPTRNRAPLVRRAIASVLAQTFSDWELIVVDDGSADNTAEVVRSFTDPRLQLLRLTDCGSPGRARNEGVAGSRGALVAFLDSDDEWLPSKLERQVACLRHDSGVAVVYCLDQRVDDQTGRKAPVSRSLPEGDVFTALVWGWNPALSSIVVKRSVLLAVGGFDPALPAFNDHDLMLRIAQTGGAFTALPGVLVIKHDYGGPQISTTPRLLLEGFERMDRKWAPVLRVRPGATAYRRWRAHLYTKTQHARVRDAVARGRYLTAWRAAVASCRFAPWASRSVASSLALAALGARGYAALLMLTDAWTRVVRGEAAW
jgi:glycosyltransferase involved in cell wall biosynthesis